MVQNDGMDGFAHRVVAAEREAHVGHAARDLGAGQILLDPARGLDEIDRVVVVLLDTGGNGEDVGVEDDVFGREAHLVHQDAISALADFDLALVGVGLALFIKRHHHGGSAIAAHQLGLLAKGVNAFFHADGIDDPLALHAAQAGLDDAPFARVNHHRHAGNIGLGGDQVQKPHHGGLAVEHGLVHVDVNDLGAVFHLLACHGQGLFKIAIQDHAGKGLGARHIGALADIDECRAGRGSIVDGWDGTNGHRLQTGQHHRGGGGQR